MARLHWTGRFGRGLAVIGVAIAVSGWQARADSQYTDQQYPAAAQNNSVARMNAVAGSVAIHHGDAGASLSAVVNAPVVTGDYITTGAKSRAEVQLDDTNFLRINAHTQVRFSQLDTAGSTVQLAAGTIELSDLRHPDSHPQIQTPSITVRPYESGRYRVTVTDSGDTIVTVRSGVADLVAPQGTQSVGAGLSVMVSGSPNAPRIQSVATVSYDDFDSWNEDRDQVAASELAAASYAEAETATSSYGNSGMVGLAQLNGYGQWYNQPAYGTVWVPYGQVAGWSPYRFGRWAWQPYYGWTWVGYEPWGWAPYHYGRWFYRPGIGWAWFPGPPHQYYWWQPALVVFFGYGSGYPGYGTTWGGVAWSPLGPGEPFNPWWPLSTGRSVVARAPAGSSVTNIGNTYHNVRAPNGVNAIRSGDLNGGMQYRYLQVHDGDLHNVAIAQGGIPVAPTGAGYHFTSGSGAVAPAAPLSPRFNTVFAARPIAAGAVNTQAVHVAPVHPINTTILDSQVDHVAPAQPVNAKSVGTQTIHAAPVPMGNQSDAWSRFVSASSGAATHPDPATDAWARYEALGIAKPSASSSLTGQWMNARYVNWSMPRIYMPMPNGAAPAGGFVAPPPGAGVPVHVNPPPSGASHANGH